MISVQFHKHLWDTLLGARDVKMNKRVSAHMYSQTSRGNRTSGNGTSMNNICKE